MFHMEHQQPGFKRQASNSHAQEQLAAAGHCALVWFGRITAAVPRGTTMGVAEPLLFTFGAQGYRYHCST